MMMKRVRSFLGYNEIYRVLPICDGVCEYRKALLIVAELFARVSKIFGGLNFRGQFRGLNFEGHFRGINPKRNRWHSSVSFSIMFYWLCFCEGGNHGSFLSI